MRCHHLSVDPSQIEDLDAKLGDPWLVVVSGFPGVGKSALAQALAPRLCAAIVSRDAARLGLRTRGPKHLVELVAWRLAHRRLAGTQLRPHRR